MSDDEFIGGGKRPTADLLKINVNEHTESKNGLTYLSWAWAWAKVLEVDPEADWEVSEYKNPDGTVIPCMVLLDGTAMVKVRTTIRGKSKTCLLPVMNHKNQAIERPNAFQVNTAIMRCLAKSISMHGLGLYIYAGEDLPPMDTEALDSFADELVQAHNAGKTLEAVSMWYVNPTIRNSNEAREYVWGQLKEYSAIRSAIKANKPQLKEAA